MADASSLESNLAHLGISMWKSAVTYTTTNRTLHASKTSKDGKDASGPKVEWRKLAHPMFRLFLTCSSESLALIPRQLRTLCLPMFVCPPRSMFDRVLRCYEDLGLQGSPPVASNTTYPGATDRALISDLLGEIMQINGTSAQNDASDMGSIRWRLALLSLCIAHSTMGMRAQEGLRMVPGMMMPPHTRDVRPNAFSWSSAEFIAAARTLRAYIRDLVSADDEHDKNVEQGKVSSSTDTLSKSLLKRLFDSA